MKSNAEAWALWDHVRTQWRAGPMAIIGLDYSAVRKEARHLGINMSMGMMLKIKALERFQLERKS